MVQLDETNDELWAYFFGIKTHEELAVFNSILGKAKDSGLLNEIESDWLEHNLWLRDL